MSEVFKYKSKLFEYDFHDSRDEDVRNHPELCNPVWNLFYTGYPKIEVKSGIYNEGYIGHDLNLSNNVFGSIQTMINDDLNDSSFLAIANKNQELFISQLQPNYTLLRLLRASYPIQSDFLREIVNSWEMKTALFEICGTFLTQLHILSAMREHVILSYLTHKKTYAESGRMLLSLGNIQPYCTISGYPLYTKLHRLPLFWHVRQWTGYYNNYEYIPFNYPFQTYNKLLVSMSDYNDKYISPAEFFTSRFIFQLLGFIRVKSNA